MRRFTLLLPLLASVLLMTGCRNKGWESFNSATGPADASNPPAPTIPKGDPYSFGSAAPASGGLNATTNYGAGANLASTGKLNNMLDQPSKGSGQQAGQYSTAAAPGFGEDNGAGLQPQPGTMTDTAPVAHG